MKKKTGLAADSDRVHGSLGKARRMASINFDFAYERGFSTHLAHLLRRQLDEAIFAAWHVESAQKRLDHRPALGDAA